MTQLGKTFADDLHSWPVFNTLDEIDATLQKLLIENQKFDAVDDNSDTDVNLTMTTTMQTETRSLCVCHTCQTTQK